MPQVDYFEPLDAEFETQNTQKCISAALRAALRDFPTFNLGGNLDATRKILFPNARLLIQAIAHWRFSCEETQDALKLGVKNVKPKEILVHRDSAHFAALSTQSQNRQYARQAVENSMVSFASAADDEEALYDEASHFRTTRLAYDNAVGLLLRNCLEDFDTPTDRAFDKPLWSERFEPVVPLEARGNFEEFFQGPSFAFWREWRQGFIDGQPVEWELQRRIALIDDGIWNAGADAVADKIKQIQARWEIERALSDLRNGLIVQAAARHSIGGNNPPERIEDERLSGAITLIWEATEELADALEQENPAREWLQAILVKLKSGLAGLLKWCAGKINLAVGTAVVVGTTKGATVVVDAYIAKHPEKIEALIEALERWLPFLS
ncbi:MAG: hypothetical protein AB3N07_05115 [Ruegeria sp.]